MTELEKKTAEEIFIQTRIITASSPEKHLEDAINKFLIDIPVDDYIDIKVDFMRDTAMIIYKVDDEHLH